MNRALNEASARLGLALLAVDEALVRADQVGFAALSSALTLCAEDLEQARAIAAGCFTKPLDEIDSAVYVDAA